MLCFHKIGSRQGGRVRGCSFQEKTVFFLRARRLCPKTVITYVNLMNGVSNERPSPDCISKIGTFCSSRCFRRITSWTPSWEKGAWRSTQSRIRNFDEFCSMFFRGIQASGVWTQTALSRKICAQTLRRNVGKYFMYCSVAQTKLKFEMRDNNVIDASDSIDDIYLTDRNNKADASRLLQTLPAQFQYCEMIWR